MWEVCGLHRWAGKSNVAEKLQRPLGAEMKSYGKTRARGVLMLAKSTLGSKMALEQLEYQKLHV